MAKRADTNGRAALARHSYITTSLDAGAPRRDVREGAGGQEPAFATLTGTGHAHGHRPRLRCQAQAVTERPVAKWVRVTLDCEDAESLAAFYADLFGWQVNARDGRGWVQVRDPAGGVGLSFQAEPNYQPPTWPDIPTAQMKMMHFEVLVHDLASAVDSVVRAGGAEAAFQPPDRDQNRLRVMLDPAGHPFCLFVEGE